MKEGWLEETLHGDLFIFGESSDGKLVDVADSDGTILSNIKRDEAEALIKKRKNIMNFIYKINETAPDVVDAVHDSWPRDEINHG